MHCTDGCTDVHNFFSSYKEIDINTKPIQFFFIHLKLELLTQYSASNEMKEK